MSKLTKKTKRIMKTIAQQLNIKEFPFEIRDENDNEIYYEDLNAFWIKSEFDKKNNKLYSENSEGYWYKSEYEDNNGVYYEDSDGKIIDNRPKKCTDKVVTIDGVDYELKEIKK